VMGGYIECSFVPLPTAPSCERVPLLLQRQHQRRIQQRGYRGFHTRHGNRTGIQHGGRVGLA
jgi:hypothetical protein